MKIIFFDDHELFAKSLEFAIKSHITSFEIFTKIDNIESIIINSSPDLVLLDIHIGAISGLDVAKQLLLKFPDLKIIFLSGFDLIEYHNEAIKMGAKGFINKNISIPEFIEKINYVASGKTLFPKFENETEPLTSREKEILQLAAEGFKHDDIAKKLFISRRTVSNHLQTVNEKLYANSTITAIVRGIELGIVSVRQKNGNRI